MRRTTLLLPAIALFAACSSDTHVEPDHQTTGETVTVTPSYGFIDPDFCDDTGTVTIVEVNLDTLVEESTVFPDALTAGGEFSVVIEVGEQGTYDVRAECPSTDAGGTLELTPDYLVVEPVLVLQADPDELAPLEAFTVTGNWCVSQFEDSDPPVAQLTYLGEELDPVVAGSAQPFGETFPVELEAPAEPGTYDITGTCTYSYECPEIDLPEIDRVAVAGEECEPESVTEEYLLARIVVTAPEVPEEPEEPRTPPAPEAKPTQGVQPTFTG